MADTLHTSGSTSTTTGSSSSHTSKQGGSSTTTFGKTWASGKVEEKTQAQRDKFNEDYQEGAKVQATYQALQDTLNQKPTFQSSYQDKLNAIYDQIMNRDKFSYDFNADPMYQMYKDQYTQGGKQAMQDTMGQAAALSGGYGSSYAQTAGQQTYQGYLTQLNNMIPTLRDQAYQQYRDEGQEMRDKYNITSDAYNREYGQFRDSMSDWQNDRAFNYGMYSDERSFDYNKYNNDRNYWAQEYWNEKNAEQSSFSQSDTSYWEESSTTGSSSSTTNTSGWDMSQALVPAGGGGGGTGGGGTSKGGTAMQLYKQAIANDPDNTKNPVYFPQTNALSSYFKGNSDMVSYAENFVVDKALEYMKKNKDSDVLTAIDKAIAKVDEDKKLTGSQFSSDDYQYIKAYAKKALGGYR